MSKNPHKNQGISLWFDYGVRIILHNERDDHRAPFWEHLEVQCKKVDGFDNIYYCEVQELEKMQMDEAFVYDVKKGKIIFGVSDGEVHKGNALSCDKYDKENDKLTKEQLRKKIKKEYPKLLTKLTKILGTGPLWKD